MSATHHRLTIRCSALEYCVIVISGTAPKPLAAWALRMKAAHYNAVENLVVFAVLVLITSAVGATNNCTAAAAAVYFWARIAHFFAYTFRIPWVRTLAFVVGWLAQMAITWHILT